MHQPPVLLVEDDVLVARSLRRSLRRRHHVVVASRMAEVERELRRWPWWGAVIIDLNLDDTQTRVGIPDHGGLSVAWLVRAACPEVPIALYTGHDVEAARRKAAKHGLAYVRKDAEALHAWLANWASRDSLASLDDSQRRVAVELIQRHDIDYAGGQLLFIQARARRETGTVLPQREAAAVLGISLRAYQKRVSAILHKAQCFSLEEIFRQLDARNPPARRQSGVMPAGGGRGEGCGPQPGPGRRVAADPG